jgi:hypothetical protein
MSFEQKQYWLRGREYERERIIALIRGSNANLLGDNLSKKDHTPDAEEEIMIDISSTNRHNDRYSEHYTPSTEEVRDLYSYSERYGRTTDESAKEFDRWLTQIKADAWDEGWRDGIVVPYSLGNPYRKKKEQP